MSIDDVSRPRKSRRTFWGCQARSMFSNFTGWVGCTWDVKKNNNGDFLQSQKWLEKNSQHHIVTVSEKEKKCYIRHVLLVMVGKARTCWWGWSFIPLFTSGSTTHIGIFSFRVHKAPISTHNRNAFFASSFSSPLFFQNLIYVCYLGFFFQQTW